MLSAAHVLAMDAKNLLDVVDSIRIRYPEVDSLICSPPDESATVTKTVVDDHPTSGIKEKQNTANVDGVVENDSGIANHSVIANS